MAWWRRRLQPLEWLRRRVVDMEVSSRPVVISSAEALDLRVVATRERYEFLAGAHGGELVTVGSGSTQLLFTKVMRCNVFGQSAGAMGTQTLCSSPLAKPYIAKAILQSGGSYGQGLHRDMPLADQEHYGEMFAEVAEVKSLEEMRGLSANRVLALIPQLFAKAMPEAQGLFLTPTMDGRVLDGGYYEIMDDGRIADIPYLIGCTKDDILTTPEMAKPADDPLYQGCFAFSHKLEEIGRKPAYTYYFTRDLSGDNLGVWHSSELWYTMGTFDRCWRPWTEGDRALEARILDYWTNFMKSGDPNGAGLPAWRPCDRAESFVMELNV